VAAHTDAPNEATLGANEPLAAGTTPTALVTPLSRRWCVGVWLLCWCAGVWWPSARQVSARNADALRTRRTPWNGTLWQRTTALGGGGGFSTRRAALKLDAQPDGSTTSTSGHTTPSGEELTYVEAALTDFLVCRAASWFVGWTSSSFSAVLAHYRHLDHSHDRNRDHTSDLTREYSARAASGGSAGAGDPGYFFYCADRRANGTIRYDVAPHVRMHTCKQVLSRNRTKSPRNAVPSDAG
jgi:hypothetical protein